MIVIVVRFETDGDYRVDNETAGLASPPDDDHSHGGVFLCGDTDEAEAVLLRVIQGVKDRGEYFGGVYLDHVFSWLTSSVNEALQLFREKSEALRFGWLKLLGGNWEGTLLFMQEVPQQAEEAGKPVFRNNGEHECEMNECPVCGHIVEGEKSWEQFACCPQCGQHIDWDGAIKDALDGKGGGRMMRDVVFRGKYANRYKYVGGVCPNYGEWIYGDLVRIEVGTASISSDDGRGWFGNYRVDPDTVGQYTGLTDKNGVRIFEGDIVNYNGAVHKVVFESRGYSGYFGIVISDIETWPFGMSVPPNMMEVVGNVCDNPELLEGARRRD